jgi:hypothetical protein
VFRVPINFVRGRCTRVRSKPPTMVSLDLPKIQPVVQKHSTCLFWLRARLTPRMFAPAYPMGAKRAKSKKHLRRGSNPQPLDDRCKVVEVQRATIAPRRPEEDCMNF